MCLTRFGRFSSGNASLFLGRGRSVQNFSKLCLAITMATCLCAQELTPILDVEIPAGLGHAQNQYQCDVRVSPDGMHWAVTAKSRVKERETVLLWSPDAGQTWTATELPDSSDPDCMFAADGSLHVTMIDKRAKSDKQLGYLRSVDGGKTWGERLALPTKVDHPHVACDTSAESPRFGSIYVVGRMFSNNGIAIAASPDGGATWSVTTHDCGEQLNKGFVQNVVVSKEGVLLVGMRGKNNIRSREGAYDGSSTTLACVRSEDGGKTVEVVALGTKESPAKAGPGGMFPVSLTVHPWGASERVYFISSALRAAPQPTGLALRHSDDLGKTWSAPRSLHPELPEGLGVGQADLVANTKGVVAIRFYAAIGETGAENEVLLPYAVYAMASADGGESFGEPILLSPPALPYSPWGYQRRVLGADQNFSAVLPDGSFVFPWTDTRDRHPNYVVYLRRVRFE
jgi:hypothetical protein